jgi:hypothetical protein
LSLALSSIPMSPPASRRPQADGDSPTASSRCRTGARTHWKSTVISISPLNDSNANIVPCRGGVVPYLNERERTIMMTTRLAITTLVAAVLASAPLAADAKKYKHITHHISTMQSGTYYRGSSGGSAAQPRIYGTSGNPVGTVPAPSVGSYYWPSVGVTNAVPTWSNTGPR